MRTVCLVLLLLASCKDKPEAKPTPSPTPAPPTKQEDAAPAPDAAQPSAPAAIKPAGGFNTAAEYEAKAIAITDKLTEVFASSGTNCEKLADRLDVFLDENHQALAGADEFEAANPTAQDELAPKLQPKAKALITKMSISMQACQKHQRVQAALAKLPK